MRLQYRAVAVASHCRSCSPRAQICGLAWYDRDEGGRNNGEPGLAGRIIALNGTPEHAVTGADGGYCLEDLPAGVHRLEFSRKSDDPLVPRRSGPISRPPA